MPSPLTVFCVWTRDKFAGEYPERLAKGLQRNLPSGVEVSEWVCVTDRPGPPPGWDRAVPSRALGYEEGCWSKLDMFGWRHVGWCLYVDLDCVVTREMTFLSSMVLYDPDHLHAMKDPARPTLNSSVMLWHCRGAAADAIYQADVACKSPHRGKDVRTGRLEGPWRGDQDFIWDVVSPSGLYSQLPPQAAVSYRLASYKNAQIVVMHGRPKPADLAAGDPLAIVWRG